MKTKLSTQIKLFNVFGFFFGSSEISLVSSALNQVPGLGLGAKETTDISSYFFGGLQSAPAAHSGP